MRRGRVHHDRSRLGEFRLQFFQLRPDYDGAVGDIGIFAEVVLVIFLRLVEFGQRNDLANDGAGKAPLGQLF